MILKHFKKKRKVIEIPVLLKKNKKTTVLYSKCEVMLSCQTSHPHACN